MNVGHTEGMAGLAGVIKATLSLENAILPGLVGFEKLNPKLLLDTWRLALPLETMPWPVKGLRRASVNSFGFGGANAHLIIDDAYHYLKSRGLDGRHRTAEAPPLAGSLIGSVAASQERTPSKNYKLLPFSMHDQNGLDRLSKTLAAYLSLNPLKGERPEVDLEDLAFTLATRRSHFGIRSFAVSQTIEDLAANDLSSLTSTKQKRRGQPENIIFVFTGQGAQWPLMGRELLTHPSFSSSIARSQQYLDELGCTWSAVELLHDPGPKINIPAYCQPICTILQVALVDLLASWGVTPRATVGHSSGEIAAAYAAGGINHRDAVKIAYMRGYYCGQIQIRLKEKRGAMLAAGLTTQEAQQYIDDLVSDGSVVIGCVNSPTSVTLSGDIEGISHLEERIKIDGKFARKLRVDVAYHSPHMHSVSEDFLESLRTIEVSDNFKVPMFSSVTTKQLDKPDQLNAAYWVMNMVSAVRFSEAVNSLLKYSTVNPGSKRKIPVNWVVALELGPHEALKGPFNQCASAIGNKRSDHLISYTSLIRRGEPADKSAAEAAGLLWSLGHSIDVLGVNNFNESRKQKLMTLTDLPPYPWKHTQGFWHEPSASMSARLRPSPRTDLLGLAVDNQNSHEPHWRNLLSVSENPWTRDHAITGTILYPAAGMLIMALEAALQIAAAQEKAVRGVEFHNVNFERGLVILDIDEAVETSLSLRPHETLDWWFHWVVYSRPPGGTWIRHSFGLLTLVDDYDDAENGKCWLAQTKEFDSIKARATTRIDSKAFYTQLETIGMGYGPTFTNLTMAAVIEGEQAGHGTIAIPDTKSTMPSGIEYPHVIHPATLDAIFHLIFIALFEGKPMGEAAIPVTMEKMFVAINQPAGAGAEFVGFCTGRKINDRDSSGSLVVSDLDWSAPKVSVNNMIVRKVSSPSETATSRSEGQMTRLPQRVAELHWLEDVDLLDLASANRVVELESKKLQLLTSVPIIASAVGWLNLACHKKASLTAVVVADTIQSADIFAELVSGFAPASGVERRLAKVSIIATTDAVHGYLASHSKLQDPSSSFELLAPANTATVLQHETNEFFDLLIFHSELHSQPNNDFVANWTSQLKSDGRILVLGTGVDNGSIKASGNTAPSAEHPLRIQGFEKILVWVANTDSTLLVASRPLEVPSREQDVIYILQSADVSSRLIHFRQQLDRLFESKGIKLETKLLSDVKELSGRKIISLLESEEPLVIKWSAEQFEQFRDLVLSQSYVLWVTKGGIIEAGETSLQFAPTTGLLRAIRTEIPQIVLPHMDLSPSIDLEASLASDLVWTVFNATSESKTSAGDGVETEFAESNGSLLIPRIFGNATLDEEVNAHAEQPRPISSLLSAQHGRPVKLVDEGPSSSLTQLHWVEDLDAVAPIGSDEVEVRTKYAALEAGELDTKRSTSQQASVGRTASGIILRIGANVRDLEIGDKVFFPVFERGAFRTQLRQQQHLISKLPAGVRLEDAPHLLTILMTAYHALHNIARATSGERVLIHLLNKELRHAAIHIAREKTATVFITVSSVLEKDILLSQYHIDARHIFEPSRDITSSLTAATSGEGFDIIISDHTGASRRQGSLCLAYFGRFIDLSGKVQVSDMDTDIFNKNVSISSVVDLWRLGRPNLENLFQITSKFFGQDIIPTQASTTPIVSISALESIWNHLNETSSPGATVYFDDEAMIPIIPIKSPPVVLDPQATYVIAGGLGALGLTISDNMVTHGARHLVLLSRSGITNSRQQNGVETLKQRGCQVDTVSCDVTDPAQVMEVVKLSQERSWSIKGLIQCAMVLQVGLLYICQIDHDLTCITG
jgi:acyl transferase domain-containing protein/NADPH:quinone reductase-like Zn-dependent oxidoreductase